MRRITMMMAVACIAAFGPWATSEAQAGNDLRLGVDIGLSLNTDEFARPNVGPLARVEYFVSENLAVTGRAGFMFGLKKDGVQIHYVPILAGARYYLDGDGGLFVGGETGLTLLMASVDMGPFGSASDTSAKLSLAAGAGYDTGTLQLGGGVYIPSIGDAGDFLTLLFTVGFNF